MIVRFGCFWLGIGMVMSAFAQMPDDYQQYWNQKPWTSASYSFYAIDLTTDEILLDIHGSKTLTPASSLKMITAAKAWSQLSAQYRFATQISLEGRPSPDGTLYGDVILWGIGDPSWNSGLPQAPDLPQVARELHRYIESQGVKCIQGELVLDMSNFSRIASGSHWAIQDVANYYGGGVRPFNIAGNEYDIHLLQNVDVGDPVTIHSVDDNMPWSVISEVTTGQEGSGDQAYIYHCPGQIALVIRGTIPPGNKPFRIRGSHPDPESYLGEYLVGELESSGMDCLGFRKRYQSGLSPKKGSERILSSPLYDIVKQTLAQSDNLMAEFLLLGPSRGDLSAALMEEDKWMSDCGCEDGEYGVYDGSGLARANHVSARCLVSVLRHMSQNDTEFREVLPGGDQNGLYRRYTRGIPADAVRAKTGSMSQVRSFTGYLRTQGDREVAFGIVVNHYGDDKAEVYALMNKVLLDLYSDER